MIIQIEDYFGNDLLTLNYNQVKFKGSENEYKVIDELAQVWGYNIADLDEDENNRTYYRVQAVEIIDDEHKSQVQKLSLVDTFNRHFL